MNNGGLGLAASDVTLETTIPVTAKPETDATVVGSVISSGLTGTLGDRKKRSVPAWFHYA